MSTSAAVVRLDELMELTAVAIANYNAASHTGLDGSSPLEMLGYYVREKQIALRWLAEPMRRNLCLLQHEHEGHARGSVAKGVWPYIHFFGSRYTSHALAGRADLIGKPVRFYFDTEDVRALRVFDTAARELCVVEAQGAWRYTAHTLRMRKEILSLVRARKLHIAYNDDPVQCYLDHLRRSASEAEIVRRVIDAAAPVPKVPFSPADKKAQFDCATSPIAAPYEEAQKAKKPGQGQAARHRLRSSVFALVMAKEKSPTASDGRTLTRPVAIDHHPLSNAAHARIKRRVSVGAAGDAIFRVPSTRGVVLINLVTDLAYGGNVVVANLEA